MIRTISTSERNLQVDAPRVVTLVAATPTEIFPDDTYNKQEVATRYLQNLTGDDLYISFGLSGVGGAPVCDGTGMFHTVIADKQLFDCFPTRRRVCAYSAGGGRVSTTRIVRNDLSHAI